MTMIAEQIWDYIDGQCDEISKLKTEAQIASDEAYRSVYKELLALHQQISAIDLDEPSMAFNRNVMDLVNQEPTPVSLKTKVDQRIIYSIAAFFIFSILAVFIYAVAHSEINMPKLVLSVNLDRYLTPALMKAFGFADIIIGFFYLDGLLRKNRVS